MLAEGAPLALVKGLIDNLMIPPPPTPAQQQELDALTQKGLELYVSSGAYKQ